MPGTGLILHPTQQSTTQEFCGQMWLTSVAQTAGLYAATAGCAGWCGQLLLGIHTRDRRQGMLTAVLTAHETFPWCSTCLCQQDVMTLVAATVLTHCLPCTGHVVVTGRACVVTHDMQPTLLRPAVGIQQGSWEWRGVCLTTCTGSAPANTSFLEASESRFPPMPLSLVGSGC